MTKYNGYNYRLYCNGMPLPGRLIGLTIFKNKKVWQFPRDRFVEYGPEDESWARAIGFGKEIEVTDSVEMFGHISDFRILEPYNNLIESELVFHVYP